MNLKQSNEFVSPAEDLVFKTMWLTGNKSVRTFLERIIEYSIGRKLGSYKLGSNEIGISSRNSIANKIDILIISDDNSESINVEMNRLSDTSNKPAFEMARNKSIIYLSKLVGTFYDNKRIEDRYVVPIKVEQVNLNTFHCREDKLISKMVYEFVDKNYTYSSNGIKSHHIYLPRMKELCYTEEEDIYKDFSLFMCRSYEEMETFAKGNKEREEVIKFLKNLGGDGKFMALIDREEYFKLLHAAELRGAKEEAIAEGLEQGIAQGIEQGIEQGIAQGIEQGIEQGIAQGIEQGIEQGIAQSAYKLYKNGTPKEYIVKSLDISENKLEDIIKARENS